VREGTRRLSVLEMRFAIFNRWQEINSPSEGRFLERISPSAYRKSLKESFGNIRAILSQGKDPSLGSSVLGNIASIREEADRAVARVNLFRSVPGLLLDGFRAGVYGASFRGEPIKARPNTGRAVRGTTRRVCPRSRDWRFDSETSGQRPLPPTRGRWSQAPRVRACRHARCR